MLIFTQSFLGRLVRRWTTQTGGEEGAQLLFRISGRRLVVFDPATERAHTRLQFSDVEGMMDSRVNGQSNCRTIRPCTLRHFAAPLGLVPLVGLADSTRVGAVIEAPGTQLG